MQTAEITFWINEERHDPIIAALGDMGADAFMQEDDRLLAYMPAERLNEDVLNRIHTWLEAHGVEARVEENTIDSKNWNADWEKTIQPHVIGDYVIAPTWADRSSVSDDKTLIQIVPKSSFGTGYHESTRLILRLLPGSIRAGAKVLDAGTGTGVLAIAAIKSGAAKAITFDNNEWAQENAVENFALNSVSDQVTFRTGSMETVPEVNFDLILANITLEVLKEMMPAFRQKLKLGGRLLLSGLLQRDRDDMLNVLSSYGFSFVDECIENEWWAVAAEASGPAPEDAA